MSFAFDPIYGRHLDVDPRFLAGLEMMRYMKETGTRREQCAEVAVKNKGNALLNPKSVYGAKLTHTRRANRLMPVLFSS